MLINHNQIYWYICFCNIFPIYSAANACAIICHANKAHRQRASQEYRQRKRQKGWGGGASTTCLDGGCKAVGERQSLFSFGRSCNTSLIHVTNTWLHSHTDTPRHSQSHTLTNAFHRSHWTHSHEYTTPLFICCVNRSPPRLLLNRRLLQSST